MRFSLLALLPAVLAAPLAPREEDVLPGRWIMQLSDDLGASIMDDTVSSVTSILGAEPDHTFNIGSFRGMAFGASDEQVAALREMGGVQSIEPDFKVFTSDVQRNPPYGLARISHRTTGANTYDYDGSAGAGTFSYIIDTGIRVTHQQFGGRATFGANFVDNVNTDGNGHGTHVAGTTGGSTYGVAKRTNLIAVKVLGANGSGSNSGVIAGIQWAANDVRSRGRAGRAVANMSLGGSFSQATNNAVNQAVAQGLFFAVAAGNSNAPASTQSPASAASACTVGATDINDNRASFSNFGPAVDVFAPGVNIISSWRTSDTATNTISGTSMATPHVAGLGAYLLGLQGGTAQSLCGRIRNLATAGRVRNAGNGSPNLLAFNGFT